MLGYSTIAATAPADMDTMSGHLMAQTIPQSVADLARYYTKGTAGRSETDELIASLALHVHNGTLTYGDALDELMLADLAAGGGAEHETRDVLSDRLNHECLRLDLAEDGLTLDSVELRPDTDDRVLAGLGLVRHQLITRDHINALMAGRRADGEKIAGKTYSTLRTYVDHETGDVKERVPLGAIDFTLSPDKSVSVAWAFANPAEQAAIYLAHREAARETMEYLADTVGVALRGRGGSGGMERGHVTWLAFDHYTARPTLWMAHGADRKTEAFTVQVAGDPDLHTHFVVPNAVFTDSGHVGSLTLDRLDGMIHEAGALYQAHLATKLRALGANVVLDQRTGMARLADIPEAIRDLYSKKTKNGEVAARQFASAQGLDWDTLPEARRVALLKSAVQARVSGADEAMTARLRKDDCADFDSWQKQARDAGWAYRSVFELNIPPPPIDPAERDRRVDSVGKEWLADELSRRAVVSEPDIRTAALRGLIAHGITDRGDVDRAVARWRQDGVQQSGERTSLIREPSPDPVRHARFTTALHADQERELIDLARQMAGRHFAALSRVEVRRAINRTGIDLRGDHGAAQRQAIDRLGSDGDLAVFIGAAGMGKTTALRPLVDAWHEAGRDVWGLSLSWRQSEDLTDAGIDKQRVSAVSPFLHGLSTGRIELTDASVVVVDELSLLSTRDALSIIRALPEGAKLVMVGDDRQCQSVEAGPVIDILRSALGPDQIPEVLTTRRQDTERERDIAGLMRLGRVDAMLEALDMKAADGTLRIVPGVYADAVEDVAQVYARRIRANADDPEFSITVSAPRNSDAHAIGEKIRQVRRHELHEVGPDLVRVSAYPEDNDKPVAMAIASGDRLRVFQSVRAPGKRGVFARNGKVLTVMSANERSVVLRHQTGAVAELSWDALRDINGRLRIAYGDVLTTHTAQGSTATEHIYALPGGSRTTDSFGTYASGSRHRVRSWIVTSEAAERQAVAASRPRNDARPVTVADITLQMARSMGTGKVKTSATDLLDAAKATRQKTRNVMIRAGMRNRGPDGRVAVAPAGVERLRAAAPARAMERHLAEAQLDLQPQRQSAPSRGPRIGI